MIIMMCFVGTVLIIAVCVGVAVLLILAVVIILVCLRRKGYEIPFCKRFVSWCFRNVYMGLLIKNEHSCHVNSAKL